MKYMGGKYHLRKDIAEILNPLGGPYWIPFVGSGWVLSELQGRRYASDINAPLIAFWEAVQRGWRPPLEVSESMYHAAKKSWELQDGRYVDPLIAFIAFGCSWGGKWFGGFARDGKRGERNYARETWSSIRKYKLEAFRDVTFFVADFLHTDPPEDNMVIYADPPYKGTTGYTYEPTWDPKEFWDRARHLSSGGHRVFVSEYNAPEDCRIVLTKKQRLSVRSSQGCEYREEKLWEVI